MDQIFIIAIQAAIEAGKEIIKVYEGDFDVELKEDDSPLTLADKNANAVINRYLESTGLPIISEENAQIDYGIRKEWEQCWIVDPLDGTKEFVKRNDEFTVNIALVKNGKPIFGVIYVPVTKELYYGDVLTKEARFFTLTSTDDPIEEILKKSIKILPISHQSDKMTVVGSRSHMNLETSNFVEELKNNHKEVVVISKGSSLKFCLVAKGEANLYPRFAPTMEWDTAAAHAICNASGVSVRKHSSTLELTYNKENLVNPWFIVSL